MWSEHSWKPNPILCLLRDGQIENGVSAVFAAECLLLTISGCKLVNEAEKLSSLALKLSHPPSPVSGMKKEVHLCTQGHTQAFLFPKADRGQLLQFVPYKTRRGISWPQFFPNCTFPSVYLFKTILRFSCS